MNSFFSALKNLDNLDEDKRIEDIVSFNEALRPYFDFLVNAERVFGSELQGGPGPWSQLTFPLIMRDHILVSEDYSYDAIPDGHRESFGELGQEIKSRYSHRALAVRAMLNFLAA